MIRKGRHLGVTFRAHREQQIETHKKKPRRKDTDESSDLSPLPKCEFAAEP